MNIRFSELHLPFVSSQNLTPSKNGSCLKVSQKEPSSEFHAEKKKVTFSFFTFRKNWTLRDCSIKTKLRGTKGRNSVQNLSFYKCDPLTTILVTEFLWKMAPYFTKFVFSRYILLDILPYVKVSLTYEGTQDKTR